MPTVNCSATCRLGATSDPHATSLRGQHFRCLATSHFLRSLMLQPSGHCTTSLSLTVSGNRAFKYLLHNLKAAEKPGSFLSSTDFSPASDKEVVHDKGWFHTQVLYWRGTWWLFACYVCVALQSSPNCPTTSNYLPPLVPAFVHRRRYSSLHQHSRHRAPLVRF